MWQSTNSRNFGDCDSAKNVNGAHGEWRIYKIYFSCKITIISIHLSATDCPRYSAVFRVPALQLLHFHGCGAEFAAGRKRAEGIHSNYGFLVCVAKYEYIASVTHYRNSSNPLSQSHQLILSGRVAGLAKGRKKNLVYRAARSPNNTALNVGLARTTLYKRSFVNFSRLLFACFAMFWFGHCVSHFHSGIYYHPSYFNWMAFVCLNKRYCYVCYVMLRYQHGAHILTAV